MRHIGLGLFSLALAVVVCASGAGANTGNPLVEAVKARDVTAVRELLTQRTDVNLPEPDGATALHWAAYIGDAEIATLLIRAGARVNVLSDLGVAPLSLACEHGNAATVEALVKATADPGVPLPSGVPPLLTCVRTGNVDSVKALLAHGADVDTAERSEDQTALMWAAAEGHLEVARTLLQHGADIGARSKSGSTPLLFAARAGALDVVELLLAASANINETAPDGTSALLMATVRGHSAVARALLDLGANPNLLEAGYTPLHWAVGTWETMLAGRLGIKSELSGLKVGKLELIKELLAQGADPNIRTTKSPPRFGNSNFRMKLEGATPFFIAAIAADVEVMRLLVASGADPRLGLPDGTTPLMMAAGLSRIPAESSVDEETALEAVELILDLGEVDVNAANTTHDDTALHGVAYLGWERMLELLVDHGANVNVVNQSQLTPFLIADGHGDRRILTTVPFHDEMAEMLLAMGADPVLGVPIP